MLRQPRLIALGFIAALVIGALGAPAVGESASVYPSGATGHDVSFPQCGATLPKTSAFGIVGVTNGLPWSANPCLASQYAWAGARPNPPSFYMNTANPGPISTYWNRPGPRACLDPASYTDTGCAYNYGWTAAENAFQAASSATSAAKAAAAFWWIDVETVNSWNGTKPTNVAAIQGYADYLASHAAGVGIYSTAYQWSTITGGASFAGLPNWIAGASNAKSAPKSCGKGFSGGGVWLVQYSAGGFDTNYACAPGDGAQSTPTPKTSPTPTPKSHGNEGGSPGQGSGLLFGS